MKNTIITFIIVCMFVINASAVTNGICINKIDKNHKVVITTATNDLSINGVTFNILNKAFEIPKFRGHEIPGTGYLISN